MLAYLPLIICFALLFLLELFYFKLADYFNIIDKPNHRSSHSQVTIRGGGIVFLLAGLFFFVTSEFQYSYFIIGLVAIGLVSFLDDILTLNNKVRLLVHLFAVLLLFLQWELFALPWYWVVIGLIFVIGTINAYNFMDGINGITGLYSLVVLASLWYINQYRISFVNETLLNFSMISVLVFNFFNFRKKAKCFAGDVGSVSIAFIIVFCLGLLIIQTQNFAYILFLAIYGLDAATTVFFRKIRKENIFEAHRSHFYQYLSNELKWPHLLVSTLYGATQLIISIVVFLFVDDPTKMLLLFLVLIIVFIGLRFIVEGSKRLLSISVVS